MITKAEILKILQKHKKKLLKDVYESKELVILLQKSITTDLTEKEQSKVKEQILDICKAVPVLGVFLLPGGSLIMPILLKFFPTILPSSYRENDEEE